MQMMIEMIIGQFFFGFLMQLFRRLVLKMEEKPKRSMRDRKPPKYFSIDVSMSRPETLGTDPFPYSHTNHQKESNSLNSELNANAKVLIKFVNTVNKSTTYGYAGLRDHESREEPTHHQRIMGSSNQNGQRSIKTTQAGEGVKKQVNGKRDLREESSKRDREHYQSRDQRERSEIHNSTLRNSSSQKPKAVGQSSTRLPLASTSFGPDVLSMMQNLSEGKIAPGLSAIMSKNDLSNSQVRSIYEALAPIQANQEPNLPDKFLFNPLQERAEERKNKLFGRSAYHIAIAYHIHLQKAKNSPDQTRNLSELDPTYHSKKLKEKNRQNYDQK